MASFNLSTMVIIIAATLNLVSLGCKKSEILGDIPGGQPAENSLSDGTVSDRATIDLSVESQNELQLVGIDNATDNLVMIDINTGESRLIGDLNGNLGSQTDPQAMAWHFSKNILWTWNKTGFGLGGGYSLSTVDSKTGLATPVDPSLTNRGHLSDLAFNSETHRGSLGSFTIDRLYGLNSDSNISSLYEVDLRTGATKAIMQFENLKLGAITFDGNGSLFGIESNGQRKNVYLIDLKSRTTSLLFEYTIALGSIQDLEIDRKGNFLVISQIDQEYYLSTIDSRDGEVIGLTKLDADISGFGFANLK